MEDEKRREECSFLLKVENRARTLPLTYRVADKPRHFSPAASPQMLTMNDNVDGGVAEAKTTISLYGNVTPRGT